MKRVILIVLDSVGIGAMEDSFKFGDEGSHTLGNIYKQLGNLNIPNLYKLGISNIKNSNLPDFDNPIGSFGRMKEATFAKDTTCGHWEMCGLILDKPFKTYPNGFPLDFITNFEKKIGRSVLANTVASGTQIIEDFGDEHLKTQSPIVYTSADSVFQIACHEDVVSIEQLYDMCKIAFELLKDYNIARVIARPFKTVDGKFVRTSNRKDFSVAPPRDTILDELKNNNYKVHAIGKIEDIFCNAGITSKDHTTNNQDGINSIIDSIKNFEEEGLIFANLVDFDMIFGHRNDVLGYAKALEFFDTKLQIILDCLKNDDLLIITADHGCDPTTSSTDHSREYVPVLCYGKNFRSVDLKTRNSFSDVGATIIEYFGLPNWHCGESFLAQIKK